MYSKKTCNEGTAVILYSTYSKVKENQVSPRQMLKIMLYAYHERNYSSRGIEKACNRDINYM